MVGQAIKWMLTGFGTHGYNPQYDIYDVVGDSVFPDVIPQNVSFPALTYRIEKNDPDKVKGQRAPNNRITLEINVVDKNYSTVIQLTTLIKEQLHRYSNSYNSANSTTIGYGTTTSTYQYGMYAPASTGDTQYVGGIQIQYLQFDSCIETYDDKLELFKNTLLFDMVYIDDPSCWGADLFFKVDDLNLMATNINPTDDPLYTQPLALDNGINYLFPSSVLQVGSENINTTTYDGLYENFNDPSGTSNTNRPLIKTNTIDASFKNKNYIQFDSDKFLLSMFSNQRLNRKYKETTIFGVVSMPGSYSASKSSAVIFKPNSETSPSGCVYLSTVVAGDPSTTGTVTFYLLGLVLEDDGAGTITHRGISIKSFFSWPFFGILADANFEKPTYIALSLVRDSSDTTKCKGEVEMIFSSDVDTYDDFNDNYFAYSDVCSGGSFFFRISF